MASEFEKLAQRVEDLERRMRGAFRQGTVAEVDPEAGTVRLKLGEGDRGDFLSAPVAYAQTAGAMKFHNPPSEGQQMMLLSPDGDLRHALAMPFGFSDANASPSGAGDQHVMTLGSATIRIAGDGVSVSVAGVTVTIDGAGLHADGGMVDHNGTDIGDTHTHSGIQKGPSRTGTPK